MFSHIETALNFVKGNWENLWLVGVIMVSAITVLIGILKPLLFDKIKCKQLRRTSLAFSNVALCFGGTAIWFLAKSFSYEFYLHTATVVSLVSIVWYWIYENTPLRWAIHKIGSMTLKKIYAMVSNKLDKVDEIDVEKEIESLIINAQGKVKAEKLSTKTSAKKVDKELKDL